MGGGNAQKREQVFTETMLANHDEMQTAMARAKKQAMSKKAGGGSQLKSQAAAMNRICSVCKQSFHTTAKVASLQEHVDSKHSKLTFQACFPNESPP